ncbi:uncharacterized protein N7500_003963 [Penicillium coprophilum]|uniref:uncharacterized protein n=1 Tax=Penicillium coprophilum TaxID=36646 RepID=UPI002399DD88|nr:uncharacterized protein N7500_003963 [Penicillium coprophilum]KAJ5171180.1 hypothetical protein N7500_003963 [Penicillium coprophilum]
MSSEEGEEMIGLTDEGNVDPSQFNGGGSHGRILRYIAEAPTSIYRPLDWADGPQHLVTGIQRSSALGQQFGIMAPEGKECSYCLNHGGIFKSCVAFAYNISGVPMVMYEGSCMNCHWEKSTDAPASKTGRTYDKSSTKAHSLTGPQYDRIWYSSPLDDPTVGSKEGYREKRIALRSLESAKHRIDHDIAKITRFLTETGHIDSSSDNEDGSGAENVFAGFKHMKVGTEAERKQEEEEEGNERHE